MNQVEILPHKTEHFFPVLHIFLKNIIILNLIFQNLHRICDGNFKTADHLLLITIWYLYLSF